MRTRAVIRVLLTMVLPLTIAPALSFGQGKPGPAPPQEAKAPIIHVRLRGGGALSQGVQDQIRRVPNVGRIESFLEGKTSEGVRVIGVDPAPVLHLRSGNEVVTAAIVQGRGLEAGDAPEAMVVGKTFAQNNKTALGLSIPAMLTKDHFPPIIVGSQGFAIVGIYATGDSEADDQVLVLLPTAQKLLNQPSRLSGVYVTPVSPAAADQVAGDLRRALGRTVEVALLAGRPR